MLGLTLKEGEYIMLGDDIQIQFFQELPAKTIRLRIDAPKSVSIVRSKPYEKNLSENAELNATRLKELDLQKQRQEADLKKAKEKERMRKQKQMDRKLAKQQNVESPTT